MATEEREIGGFNAPKGRKKMLVAPSYRRGCWEQDTQHSMVPLVGNVAHEPHVDHQLIPLFPSNYLIPQLLFSTPTPPVSEVGYPLPEEKFCLKLFGWKTVPERICRWASGAD